MIYVPDGLGGMGMQYNQDPETLRMAKAIIKEHKAEKKRKAEEEKKKEAKSKPRVFSFLETTGLVLLGSIPVTIAQLALLNYAQTMMNTLLNGTH